MSWAKFPLIPGSSVMPLGILRLAAAFGKAEDQRLRLGKRGKLIPQPSSLVISSSSFSGLCGWSLDST